MGEVSEELEKSKVHRVKLSDCQKVREENEIEGNFTSVIGEYYVPSAKRTGFFKLNKSFGNNPDLRELLASRLLKKIGIPVADVLLAYDDVNNEYGCLSMSVLEENEKFLELDIFAAIDDYKVFEGTYGIERFIQQDLYEYSKQHNIPPEFFEERRKYLIENAFISALLGNDDVKSDNCKIIYNAETGRLRNPPYYDMGMSFEGPAMNPDRDKKNQRYFFHGQTDIEVLNELYHKYPHEVADISKRVAEKLDRDSIKKILSDEVFEGLSEETRERIWMHLGKKLSLIERKNRELYGIGKQKGSFMTSVDDVEDVARTAKLPLIERARAFLQRLRFKQIEDKDK